MKLKRHLQNQSLAQLEFDWRSLTYAQRITLRLIAEADIAKQTTRSFIQKVYEFPIVFLATLHTYPVQAHWVEPYFLEKKKKKIALIHKTYLKIFIIIIIDILLFASH